jgi:protein-S-isoprenylcysteine O-methyltransferase Ste14
MISLLNVTIVAGCLVLFIVINLDNLVRYHASRSATSGKPEIEKQIATPLLLAGIGTVAFFLDSFLYVLVGLLGYSNPFLSAFGVGTMGIALVESFGSLVMILGYAIFIWSVLVRGKYATSWQMPADQKLVDWGPYRYVRHPSYFAYFLMFAGFLLMWPNILTLIPLVAVPGYLMLTVREEEMLVTRFKQDYVRYQKHTGRFTPRIRKRGRAGPDDQV